MPSSHTDNIVRRGIVTGPSSSLTILPAERAGGKKGGGVVGCR